MPENGNGGGGAGERAAYMTLAELRALPRLERDVEVEGIPRRFRVQAVSYDEDRKARWHSRYGDTLAYDTELVNEYLVAYGLIDPNLAETAAFDIDEALAEVRKMHRALVEALADAIKEISYADAGESFMRQAGELYQSFFASTASRSGSGGGLSSMRRSR